MLFIFHCILDYYISWRYGCLSALYVGTVVCYNCLGKSMSVACVVGCNRVWTVWGTCFHACYQCCSIQPAVLCGRTAHQLVRQFKAISGRSMDLEVSAVGMPISVLRQRVDGETKRHTRTGSDWANGRVGTFGGIERAWVTVSYSAMAQATEAYSLWQECPPVFGLHRLMLDGQTLTKPAGVP